MLKKVFLSSLAGLWMIFYTADTIAQGKKPSQALRQVAEHQKKSLETFDNDLASKKAQPYEWDERTEALKRYAAEQAVGFKIQDWRGEELLALATLYQRADLFASAVEAYGAYLVAEPKAKREPTVIVSLIRALTETEQLSEAENLLEGMDWIVNSN